MSIKVSQLIRRGVITVDASSTIRDAARVMADNNNSASWWLWIVEGWLAW